MAAAFVITAVIGFLRTYWIPLAQGTFDRHPIVHVHALLFHGWTLWFLLQTSLAAKGRLDLHRATGVAGVALATAMCLVGLAVAVNSLRVASAAGFEEAARRFSVVPVTGVALFAVLLAIALLNVARPDVHKRLMLVATASLLQAGVGRLFALVLAPGTTPGVGQPPPVFVTIMPGLVVDLFIVAGMIYDRKTRGKVHPVYWIAGASVLAVQLLRVPLSGTGVWKRVMDCVAAFVP